MLSDVSQNNQLSIWSIDKKTYQRAESVDATKNPSALDLSVNQIRTGTQKQRHPPGGLGSIRTNRLFYKVLPMDGQPNGRKEY